MESPFEPKNLFRNVYFWLAVGGVIFILYVGLVALFLPRSTSEVKSESELSKSEGVSAAPIEKNLTVRANPLNDFNFRILENGGWIDTEDRKITVVLNVFNLKPKEVEKILESRSFEVKIDGTSAEIINSEPYKKTGFLTRVKADLPIEKFDKFTSGEIQTIDITVQVTDGSDQAVKSISRRFSKRDKTEVEGVKIVWK